MLIKKLVKEVLNEKFSEDSDPVHDMGIGVVYKKIREFRDILSSMYDESYDEFTQGSYQAQIESDTIEEIIIEFDRIFEE